MADIFISYSKQDPEHTVALAADLEARGYSVWWDTSLLPGDEFPDIIKRRIDEAKVVIVIWTAHSVASKWVRAEATHADQDNKLITLAAPGLNYRAIPMPFNTRHCEPVSERAKLYKALAARIPPPARAPQESAADLYERGGDYYFGQNGFPQDYKQAVAFVRRAADMGHADAIHVLGLMYADGEGVSRDGAEAVRLFRKAADMGNADAINNLGSMYGNGKGVARDEAEAVRLFRKAADMGHAGALYNLGVMYGDGIGVARDEAEAVRLFRKAADLGDADACYNLALSYENGSGVPRSKEDARRWYRKAADLGVEEAKEALKRF